MSTLLALCLGAYLFMSVTVFKSDKTQLVFDLNRSQVVNLTSEIETQLRGISEKLKVFALLPNELKGSLTSELISEGSELVAVRVFHGDQDREEKSYVQAQFLETYGLQQDFFNRVTEHRPIPFNTIVKTGEDIWNASLPDGPPLIGYGRLVVQQDNKGFPTTQFAVVGYIKLDRLLKGVALSELSEVYVTNARGEILVHPDSRFLAQAPSAAADDLFKEALAMKTKVAVLNREMTDGRVLAAMSRGYKDQIYVIARAPEAKVFRVVRDLSTRTLLFGLIVLTLVIIAAILISRSLTENIDILVDGMDAVARGDLDKNIHLKGQDETILLANTFNRMIQDLRESRHALESLNSELDQKVKDRTEQLEQQNHKIKEVQEALIHTTRLASLGELAGRTAHEVLNPLTILLTRAGLMQKRLAASQQNTLGLLTEIQSAWAKDYHDGGFDRLTQNWKSDSKILPGKNLFQEDLDNLAKVQSEYKQNQSHISTDVQFIKEEGERIAKIINNMRRLGRLKSDSRIHSLHSILEDCCTIMADLFAQKGFKIERAFTATNDQCHVDRDELVQAITNLMRNSLQALESRKFEAPHAVKSDSQLTLKLRTFNNRDTLNIEIEDNGVGILPEHQDKLFEASFTTKSHENGTGLGLGISRRFIRSYGGDIEFVNSQPGEKTIFRIQLPVHSEGRSQGTAA